MVAEEAFVAMFAGLLLKEPVVVKNKSNNSFKIIDDDCGIRLQKKQPQQHEFHDIGHLPYGKYEVVSGNTAGIEFMMNTCKILKFFKVGGIYGKFGN